MSSPGGKRAASPGLLPRESSKRQKQQEAGDDPQGADPHQDRTESADAGAQEDQSQDSSDGEASDAPADDSQDNHHPEQLAGHDQDDEARREAWKNLKKVARNRKGMATIVEEIYLAGNTTGHFSTPQNDRPSMSRDERQRLMDELEDHLGEIDEPDTKSEMPSCYFSAPVDDLRTAADFLGIDLGDLENIRISPSSSLRLRIDQVQNVAFMVRNAEGLRKGAVNANEHGTGKTVETLAAVYFLASRQEAHKSDKHKATLILCPHQALRCWQDTHASFFSDLLELCLYTKLLTPGPHSTEIDTSKEALVSCLDDLKPSDPRTSRTVILSTYDEFAGLFLTQRAQADIIKEKKLANPGSSLTEEWMNAIRVASKPQLYDLDLASNQIGVLIADEAHEIKDPLTQRAHVCYLMEANINFLLTASPLRNKVSDFRGLLFALYKPKEWTIYWPVTQTSVKMLKMYDADFDPVHIRKEKSTYTREDADAMIPRDVSSEYKEALKNGQNLWRLNPHAYRWLGHQMGFGADFARIVVGSIFRLFVLRRDPASVIQLPSGEEVTVADVVHIPSTRIRTIELEMTEDLADMYRRRTAAWFSSLHRTGPDGRPVNPARVCGSNETPNASFDRAQDSHLDTMTADPGLADVLCLRQSSLVEDDFERPAVWDQILDFEQFKEENIDAGMTFYYAMTRLESDPEEPPTDRASMIRHIVRRSPKLQWLLLRLNVLKQRKEKALVYCVHPSTQWLIEGLMAMAEFNFYSLRSKHGIVDVRDSITRKFNDANIPVDFLVSTMRLLGHGVELQHDCSNMIIFEMPDNIPTMLSAIGRIRRVGQKKEQNIVLLTLAKSYDDYTLHRQYSKYAKALLGMGVLGTALDQHVRTRRAQYEAELGSMDGQKRRRRARMSAEGPQPPPEHEIEQLLAAGEMARRQLGARWNRAYLEWTYEYKEFAELRIGYWMSTMELPSFAADECEEGTEQGQKIVNAVQTRRSA